MLVGFAGSSGSGKTTLVNAIAEKINCGVVREVVRDVFNDWRQRYGFESLAEIRMYSPTRFQLEVLREQVKREDEELASHDIVITDRTIYDNLFFAIFYHDDVSLLNRYLKEFRRRELERKYNLLFVCQAVNADVDDGFRTPDIAYRELQEFVVRRLVPYRTLYVPAIPVDRRVNLVLSHINFARRWSNAR